MKHVDDEAYKGENTKLFEFFKRTVIRRYEDGEPYLIRLTIFSLWKLFSIKYHKILLSDDVCSHDHPWPFLTFILKGGYNEWTPKNQNDSGKYVKSRIGVDGVVEECHFHKPGSVMYRPAKWRHQLELREDKNGKPIPAHTLAITFLTFREWGFFTKDGWKIWTSYNKARDCN